MSSRTYLQRLQSVLATFPHDAVQSLTEAIRATKTRRGTVYLMGNGGSASLASHWAADLNKCAGVRAVSLCDAIPWMMAIANDLSFGDIFAQQLVGVGKDALVVGISTSGRSRNVLAGLAWQARSWALTGQAPNPVSMVAGGVVAIASTDTQIVEDCHNIVAHMVLRDLMEEP